MLLLLISIAPAVVVAVSGLIALPAVQSSRAILMTMAYSALLALGCSLASIVLGLPGAYLFASYRFPLKSFFTWLFALAMVIPTTVTALLPQLVSSMFAFIPDIP
ncbi:MAG: hypothetical protein IJ863_05465, partial [Spirochaetales bacterium]|nr:hypothetical protein [Spirochaetales bacterium]